MYYLRVRSLNLRVNSVFSGARHSYLLIFVSWSRYFHLLGCFYFQSVDPAFLVQNLIETSCLKIKLADLFRRRIKRVASDQPWPVCCPPRPCGKALLI